jgi:hypothetical protein
MTNSSVQFLFPPSERLYLFGVFLGKYTQTIKRAPPRTDHAAAFNAKKKKNKNKKIDLKKKDDFPPLFSILEGNE